MTHRFVRLLVLNERQIRSNQARPSSSFSMIQKSSGNPMVITGFGVLPVRIFPAQLRPSTLNPDTPPVLRLKVGRPITELF